MKTETMRVIALGTVLVGTNAWAVDVDPPTITASNQVKECLGATTSVYINPVVTDNVDPLPAVTFDNEFNDVDPDNFTLWNHPVTIRARDSSGNTSQKNIIVRINDTLVPLVNLGPDKVVECASPLGTLVTLAPSVSDQCDGTLEVSNDAPEGNLYGLGLRLVTVTATDDAGNEGTDDIRVTVRDTVAPGVEAGSNFAVAAASDCNNGNGTVVSIPYPVVTEACTAPADLRRVNNLTNDGTRTVCLPNNTSTTVTWTVFDGQGLSGSDSVTVTVGNAVLAVTATGPSGYQSGSPVVNASVAGATLPVTWQVGADQPPTAQTTVGATYAGTFGNEGVYCPLYLSVRDNGSQLGVSSDLCFAVDHTLPTAEFSSIATEWRAPGDVTQTVAVDPGDQDTWPVYFSASNLPLEVMAKDENGSVRSGVSQVRVVVDPSGTNTLVFSSTFCSGGGAPGTLPACPLTQLVAGCNQLTPVCTGAGRLDLSALPVGPHTVRVVVTDLAGNVNQKDYHFRVGDLGVALDASIDWTEALRVNGSTPMASYNALDEAARSLKTAKALYQDSIGHAFLLSRKVWTLFETALNAGARTQFLMGHVAEAVANESRRVVEETASRGMTNWAVLNEWPDTPAESMSQENYRERTFLMTRGGIFSDFIIEVAPTLDLATQYADLSDEQVGNGEQLAAIDTAIEANNALVMLFTDLTMAALFAPSYALHEVDPGVVEAYYRGSRPARFGDFIARTVSNQINRVANNPSLTVDQGIPAEAVATLGLARDRIAQFADAVAVVKDKDWRIEETGFGNEQVMRQIYLNALLALEALRTIQQSSVYTHMWLASIALTVAFVGNFTLYEGPSRLVDNARYIPAGTVLTNAGTGSCDTNAQTTECRYHRILRALVAGRIRDNIESAVELYSGSKCLMIDVYNRYYGGGAVIPTDGLIDPAEYGCVGALPAYSLQAECTCMSGGGGTDTVCNGLDDDCDGQVDEDYVPAQCGFGPCQSQSRCLNGREVPCVAGTPPVSRDLTCNNTDEDCDGATDDDWVGEVCGFGGCQDRDRCVAGEVVACVVRDPTPESCNGLDDDCDIAIDEFLDNDRDRHGCLPRDQAGANPAQCERLNASDRVCAGDDGTNWDCNDFDADVYPFAPELCDYKDNDCDTQTDENVLNDCGHCESNCGVTTYGQGGIPFNPTPGNSEGVSRMPDGTLALASESVDVNFAWVSNDSSGTVSRMDTRTGKEVGRYCTALKNVARGTANVCAACDPCNSGSRSAVDRSGNVFLANRAFSYQGTVTKIAALTRDCVDVDGDGVIRTSRDVNNNGVIDQADPNEYLGENDECILWTKKPTVWGPFEGHADGDPEPTGEGYFLPRALAIDADGDVWVGAYNYPGFFEMDPNTFKVKRLVNMGVSPYGAVIDAQGIIWAAHGCCGNGTIRSYNTSSNVVTYGVTTWNPGELGSTQVQSWSDKGNYGIAVDGQNRVWVAGHGASAWTAARFDPRDASWSRTLATGGSYSGGGRGVTVDSNGVVWVAQHHGGGGRLTGYDVDTLAMQYDVNLYPSGSVPIGVGIGSGGRVWTANRGTSNMSVYDPRSGALATYPVGGAPYTYSDFTGNLLRTFTSPVGHYTETLEACPGNMPVEKWVKLVWEGMEPVGTTLQFRIRVASTQAGLDTATWSGYLHAAPGDPGIGLTAIPSQRSAPPDNNVKWAQVEVNLEASAAGLVPTLSSYRVARDCVIP